MSPARRGSSGWQHNPAVDHPPLRTLHFLTTAEGASATLFRSLMKMSSSPGFNPRHCLFIYPVLQQLVHDDVAGDNVKA